MGHGLLPDVARPVTAGAVETTHRSGGTIAPHAGRSHNAIRSAAAKLAARQVAMDNHAHEGSDEVKPPSAYFLDELVRRAKQYGHSGDYVAVRDFVHELHVEAGVHTPDLTADPACDCDHDGDPDIDNHSSDCAARTKGATK